MERKLLKPIYECRCNGRLQIKRFMQGIQVKFLCFFEAVHELFMNVQMLFKFHGNIQIFLIIFELVLEVFMNSSKNLNSFFLRRQPQNFFFGFQEHSRQGYLDDFRRKKQLICHRHV